MSRFQTLIDNSFPDSAIPEDWLGSFARAEEERKALVRRTERDIVDAAAAFGQTPEEGDAKVDELFATFAAEWSIYILTGAPAIIDAIQNDTSLPWLNAEYPPGSGVTVRERIVNRLTNG